MALSPRYLGASLHLAHQDNDLLKYYYKNNLECIELKVKVKSKNKDQLDDMDTDSKHYSIKIEWIMLRSSFLSLYLAL